MPSRKNNPHPRPLLRFVVMALLVYALLLIPWPGVKAAYAHLFRSACTSLCAPAVEARGGKIAFEPYEEEGSSNDTLLRLGSYQTGKARKVRLSSRHMGYTTAALLGALVMATPLKRSRQIICLLIGLMFVHCFVGVRMALKVVHLGHLESVELFTLGSATGKVFSVAHHLIVTVPETKFVVAAIIWVLVCFRREDIAAFTGQGRERLLAHGTQQ